MLGARHEARWLCEVATSLDGGEFDAALDEPVTERMVAHLDAMVARYRAGEPLQYVLGRWSFRHLDLAIDRRVLIPRPETELVAELAIGLARAAGPPRWVADLGTGSGAIGLSLAVELPLEGTTVWITDASGDALAVARANLAGIGRSARNVIAAQGDWFEALPQGRRFDVIVSNPPYVAVGSPQIDTAVTDWEPADALFAGARGSRRPAPPDRRGPRTIWPTTAGWCSRSVPIRAPPCTRCWSRPATTRSRFVSISPASIGWRWAGGVRPSAPRCRPESDLSQT